MLVAEGPLEAIVLAERNAGAFRLLLTDVVMPEMNGRALQLRVERLSPGIKCLFISGYAADILADDGVIPEGMHLLSKPFSMGGLAKKLREVLGPSASPVAAPPVVAVRVYYVDDEEALLLLVKRQLGRRGHHVVFFSSGEAALLADPSACDVLLTDDRMPGMSGLDLARAVVAIPGRPRFLLTSGVVTDALRAAAAALEEVVVVEKSFGVEAVLAVIENRGSGNVGLDQEGKGR